MLTWYVLHDTIVHDGLVRVLKSGCSQPGEVPRIA